MTVRTLLHELLSVTSWTLPSWIENQNINISNTKISQTKGKNDLTEDLPCESFLNNHSHYYFKRKSSSNIHVVAKKNNRVLVEWAGHKLLMYKE